MQATADAIENFADAPRQPLRILPYCGPSPTKEHSKVLLPFDVMIRNPIITEMP